ncbi:hypothetical protein CONLIGDRAFT_675644 [Coniochaeta ligniaria NRRL 30616]|uniref:Uncharacterized protein n=1 Tax=Coniochaeta ligniaria NRRL 30616 TaxID=1408157 RepID=A0A1J7J3L8_9PEZI|nr:hypothetical protein CONLIGDRAFT_675644 [Coniochaeta ligniaria NRRL 30616]
MARRRGSNLNEDCHWEPYVAANAAFNMHIDLDVHQEIKQLGKPAWAMRQCARRVKSRDESFAVAGIDFKCQYSRCITTGTVTMILGLLAFVLSLDHLSPLASRRGER